MDIDFLVIKGAELKFVAILCLKRDRRLKEGVEVRGGDNELMTYRRIFQFFGSL